MQVPALMALATLKKKRPINVSRTPQYPPAKFERRPLDQRISFLAHRINARLNHLCNPLISPHKLDLFSSRIIVAIAEKGPMKIGELVEFIALPQSTISHQIKRLERDNHVRRTRSETDNRTVVITLTPLGEEVAEKCNQLSDMILENISGALSQEEIDVLTNLMTRVYEALPRDIPPKP